MSDDNSDAKEESSITKVARKAIDLQRMKLEKLMKNYEKPAFIPDAPKVKKFPDAPEFVRNVMGSSAGAGSGEFHVYRHIRRREYSRNNYLLKAKEKQILDIEHNETLEEYKRKAEAKTAKKRAKRQRMKLKKRLKRLNKDDKKKEESDSDSISSENSDDEENKITDEENKITDEGERKVMDNGENKRVDVIDNKIETDTNNSNVTNHATKTNVTDNDKTNKVTDSTKEDND